MAKKENPNTLASYKKASEILNTIQELERYILNQINYLKSKPKLTDIEVGMIDAYKVIQNRFNLRKRIKK